VLRALDKLDAGLKNFVKDGHFQGRTWPFMRKGNLFISATYGLADISNNCFRYHANGI